MCHSDLSRRRRQPRPADADAARPRGGGHRRGSSATGVDDLAAGDRVVMTFLPRCGDCPECAHRRAAAVPGRQRGERRRRCSSAAHRRLSPRTASPSTTTSASPPSPRHAVVSRTSVVPVDADVPPEVAALLGCAVLTGGGAVVNAGRPRAGRPRDRRRARRRRHGRAARRRRARPRGDRGRRASRTSSTPRASSARRRPSRPRTPGERGVRAPVVIEAAGTARAFETALALTAPGRHDRDRRACPRRTPARRVSPLTLTAEARTVVGSYLGSAVPAATSRATSTCGAPGGCRSSASSPPASPCTTSTSPWTASRPVASSAS